MAEPVFPPYDAERFMRFYRRRSTPGRRAAKLVSDAEAILELETRADQLLVQQQLEGTERAQQEAMERLALQRRKLPSPGDWISNGYHAGSIELWPAVRDTFAEIVESKANIIVLRGGSGTAKSFLALQLVKRSIAEIGCMPNPHAMLGTLSADKPLAIRLMHQSYQKSRDEQLSVLRSNIIDSGWFRDHCPPQARAYNAGVGCTFLAFRHMLVKSVPTTDEALKSINMPVFWAAECNEYDIVDKSSRQKYTGPRDVGFEVWKEALVRLKRFHANLDPSIRYIFDSTERYDGDLTDRLTKLLPSTGLRHIVIQRSQWEMKPGKLKGPWFFFAKPAKGKRGELVEDDARKAELEEAGREVVEVPRGDADEYYLAARLSPDDFSRDFGGWSIDAIRRFIDDPEQIARCVRERDIYLSGLGLSHDPASGLQDQFLPGYSAIDWDALCTFDRDKGIWRPRVLPDAPRHMHFDLASGGPTGEDYIGWSSGCEIERVAGLPRVYYDFALRLLREKGVRYDFAKVRELLEEFRRHGFRIMFVTFDSYQSIDFQEILKGWGYQVDQISMVKDIDGYLAFQAGYVAGLALLPAWEGSVVLEEAVQLERKTKNNREIIEHRPKRHDDVIQAAAAVYWQIKLQRVGVGVTGGKPVHSTILERQIAAATSRLWDKVDHIPPELIAEQERRIERERRREERERSRALRDRIATLRGRGVRI